MVEGEEAESRDDYCPRKRPRGKVHVPGMVFKHIKSLPHDKLSALLGDDYDTTATTGDAMVLGMGDYAALSDDQKAEVKEWREKVNAQRERDLKEFGKIKAYWEARQAKLGKAYRAMHRQQSSLPPLRSAVEWFA